MGNEYYWVNKEARAQIAKEHTIEMANKYPNEIKYAIANTHMYGPDAVINRAVAGVPTMTLVDMDSVSAAMEFYEGKTAILNFASFNNPGGRFIDGSRAQEECLCHESYLYNVLKEFPEYYEWNSKHKNRALYVNRALYSPFVAFEHDGIMKTCDVITCAAPNLSWALRYRNEQVAQANNKVLEDRIRFVLNIANNEKVETLILGAFGCGVFKQNPTKVATHFYTMLNSGEYGNIKKVIFAVPKGVDITNYNAFAKMFN